VSALAHWLSGLAPSEVRLNEPLAPWCSIRAGGLADALVRPQSVQTLLSALTLAKDTGTPLSILGLGANTIVGDLGVRGPREEESVGHEREDEQRRNQHAGQHVGEAVEVGLR
jgi:UDP-N-acetylenolpyruvoylglucosamine reductase